MKILITGSRGLLGSACVRHFGSLGHHIQELDSNVCDLGNEAATLTAFKILQPNQVIHCAARVGGVKSNKEKPIEFLLDNLRIQNSVIQAAARINVEKLVFIGTSCMFPKDATLPVLESSLLTGKLEDSVEAYAIAKLAGWRLCKAYWEQEGRTFLTVNPSNIYGQGDNYTSEAHVIPSLIRKYAKAAKSGQPFTVWGTGAAIREFIYSDDVARAIEVVLNKWESPEVVNIGTGISTSLRTLVELIRQTSPYTVTTPIVWDAKKPEGIPRKTFDVTRLKNLGWDPKMELTEGLKRTWEDFMTNPNLRR